MSLRIVVEGVPPSTNKYIGKSRSRYIYSKDKERWERLMVTAMGGLKPEKPIERASVEIRYTFPNRIRRDPDNYAGKMILDPLVRHGVLKDDNFNVIESLTLSAEHKKGVSRTLVTVTEVQ